MKQPTHKNRRPLHHFLCGLLIGGGSILPGVSGVVLAVVFGVYRPLMDFLANPKQSLRTQLPLLLPVGLGMIGGFVAFAMLISMALNGNTTVTTWCFIGLIVGTLPSLGREAGKHGRTGGCYASFAICALVVLASLRSVAESPAPADPGYIWYAVCGTMLGLGSCVPGLSSSTLLMAMGMYAPMMNAVATLDWGALACFVPWTVLSLLGLARFVTWVFDRYYSLAFHGILGIVVTSTVMIIPTTYASASELIVSLLCAISGCVLALTMVRMDDQLT